MKVLREEILQKTGASASGGDPAPSPSEVHPRLSDTARELSALRRKLRGKLPANEASTLFRIDPALTDLARKMEAASGRVCAG